MSFDVIVLGGGQNGLAAAARLAGAGRRVLIVEQRAAVGGLCAAEELHPGYTVPGVLHDEGLLSPEIARRLGLERHGLAFEEAPPVYLAETGGPGILLHRDPRAAHDELAVRSPRDAAAYVRYRAFLGRVTPLLAGVLAAPPPPLTPTAGDFLRLARHGLAAWKLGRKETTELARVAPMCVADFLNEQFETPLLVEGLAAPAVASTFAGPWSSGTTTNLLLHECGPGTAIRGGPPALVAALLAAAKAAGAEVRTGARVARIRIVGGRVTGVELATGEVIEAAAVVATCDPKQAFLKLTAPGVLPLTIEEELRRVRSRGTAAKVHLALSGPLDLGRPGEHFAAIRIGGGHVDELERAFDAVKYRRFSARPHLEIRVPTVTQPELAPAGHHVVSILVSFAPYELEGGWNEAQRQALAEAVLGVLEQHAPGVRQKIVARQVLTPADLEERYALTGGHLHHAERALDQLIVLRPTASTARYKTAVPGLFLGGSGSHPGGGVNPTPGLLAAEAVLAG